MLTFGPWAAVATAAAFAPIAAPTTASTPTTIAFAAAGLLAALGKLAFTAWFSGGIARTAVLTAKSASTTATLTTATTPMAILAEVALTARLAAGSTRVRSSARRRRGWRVDAKEALQPADETAGLRGFNDGSARLVTWCARFARFKFAFIPRITRLARLPRTTRAVARIRWLGALTTPFPGFGITALAAFRATAAAFTTFSWTGLAPIFTRTLPALTRGLERRSSGAIASIGAGAFPTHAGALRCFGREDVEFCFTTIIERGLDLVGR